MKNHVEFIYKIEGPKTEEGIDLKNLIPILINFGDVIRESNKVLFPDNNEIGINIKPFEKGSFIIDIGLFAKNNFQQLVDLFNGEQVTRIKNMLDCLGYVKSAAIGGGCSISLLGLIKWLKGKPKAVEEIEPDKFKYISNDNQSLIVSSAVHNLYQNSIINNGTINVITQPLQIEGIDRIETYLKGKEETKVEFDKTEANVLREIETKIQQEQEKSELISETSEETSLEIVSLNFLEGSKWRFTDGECSFNAEIADFAFMDNVILGKESFSKGDILRVKLIKKQSKVVKRLKTEYFIDKVLKHEKK